MTRTCQSGRCSTWSPGRGDCPPSSLLALLKSPNPRGRTQAAFLRATCCPGHRAVEIRAKQGVNSLKYADFQMFFDSLQR